MTATCGVIQLLVASCWRPGGAEIDRGGESNPQWLRIGRRDVAQGKILVGRERDEGKKAPAVTRESACLARIKDRFLES